MAKQLTVEQAAEKRDTGVERAAEHAERIDPGWQDNALAFVYSYVASMCGSSFLAEEVVDSSRHCGVDEPPDRRAWGAVMQRARREGLIEACGYAPARSSNLSPKVLWRKAS